MIIFFLFRKKNRGKLYICIFNFYFKITVSEAHCHIINHWCSSLGFFFSVHFDVTGTRNTFQRIWKMYNIKHFNSEQGWGQVKYLYLVLGTWCKLSSTWYLLVLDLFKFKSTWYLLVLDGQSTWYLSKYSSTFVKLTNIHVLVNNSPLNTISRNGSYWLCSQHGSQDVNSQDWTVSWVSGPALRPDDSILTKFLRSLVQEATCIQFGASHYNQIDTLYIEASRTRSL